MIVAIVISSSITVYCLVTLFLCRKYRGQLSARHRIDLLATTDQTAESPLFQHSQSKIDLSFLHIPQKIKIDLPTAGIQLKSEEFILIWACFAVILPLVFVFAGADAFFCFFLIALGAVLPPFYINRSRKKRLSKFNRQLEDALMVISNSLRAGFTFEQSMESVANDMPSPISEEFSKAVKEVRLGVPMDMALDSLADRMQSRDLKLMNSAVMIQRQVGGNLAEIVSKISKTIHDRIQIKKEIRTLTTQGRMSGVIISLLPIFLFFIINMISPSYMAQLYQNQMGIVMLVVSAVMEVLGFLVIHKIVDIKC